MSNAYISAQAADNRISNVSSTPTTVDQPAQNVSVPRLALDKSEMDPWAPLVLSLDGGGVRGLSSLFILRRIMLRIRELEAEESHGQADVPGNNLRLPLPCHYFDNIVGTSTGGLIAIMLGRLRMDVNDCIQQYYIICNRIFRPHQYLTHYSAAKFESAINDVIRKYCKCHEEGCLHPHTHYLRQYDYLEFDEVNPEDPTHARKINSTCRVAVLTQRKAHGRGQPDRVYLMRSYNHRSRPNGRAYSTLNRGQVDSSPLKIWEACRATAAAPFFFDKILIEGCWYIDGGVGDNNPSTHAWNEAKELSSSRNGDNRVAMLVSIGTGMTAPYTKFGGLLSLAQYARKAITETEHAHRTTSNFAYLVHADYFRFDVRPIRDVHPGLSTIKLDECKKKRKKQSNGQNVSTSSGTAFSSSEEEHNQPGPQPPARPTRGDSNGDEGTAENRELALAQMDVHNDLEASQPGIKGGYKPHKYDYTTFQTIKTRTDDYCLSSRYSFLLEQGQYEAQNVKAEIDQCARKLFEYSRSRRENDSARWQRFRRHPDPMHEANRVQPPREA